MKAEDVDLVSQYLDVSYMPPYIHNVSIMKHFYNYMSTL